MPDDDAREAQRADEETQAVGGEPTRALPEQEPNPWSSPAEPAGASPSTPPAAAAVQDSALPPPSNPYVQPPQPGYAPPPGYAAPPPGYYGPPPGYYGPTTSGRATAVLICGIASLVLLFSCIGFIPAIVALVLARGAQREIEESGGRLVGLSQLRAGRICSWITIAITALAIVGLVVFIIIGVATGGFDSTYSTY